MSVLDHIEQTMGTHDEDEPPPWDLEEVVVEDTKAAKRKKKDEDLDKLGMQVRNCACLTTKSPPKTKMIIKSITDNGLKRPPY